MARNCANPWGSRRPRRFPIADPGSDVPVVEADASAPEQADATVDVAPASNTSEQPVADDPVVNQVSGELSNGAISNVSSDPGNVSNSGEDSSPVIGDLSSSQASLDSQSISDFSEESPSILRGHKVQIEVVDSGDAVLEAGCPAIYPLRRLLMPPLSLLMRWRLPPVAPLLMTPLR